MSIRADVPCQFQYEVAPAMAAVISSSTPSGANLAREAPPRRPQTLGGAPCRRAS